MHVNAVKQLVGQMTAVLQMLNFNKHMEAYPNTHAFKNPSSEVNASSLTFMSTKGIADGVSHSV